MTPASKQSVGGGEKLVSGGVQSPSEIYAQGFAHEICQLKLTQIPRQVSRARLEREKAAAFATAF